MTSLNDVVDDRDLVRVLHIDAVRVQYYNTNSIILNTNSIILHTKFIILHTKFIILHTKSPPHRCRLGARRRGRAGNPPCTT